MEWTPEPCKAPLFKMENKRVAISKKTRFEIFKRDFFKCQYCGSTPPSVVLEIDHLTPVCEGGKNNLENLLTSCFDCNRGKGKGSLNSLPESTEQRSLILKEKLLQYKQYQKLQNELDKCIQSDLEKVEYAYYCCFPEYSLTNRFVQGTVKRFVHELGVEVVVDAMYRSCSRIGDSQQSVKYFCGVCWNKINER